MSLIGALTGAGLALGAVLIVMGAIPTDGPAAPRTAPHTLTMPNALTLTRRERLTAIVAGGVGLLMAVLLGWFVALLLLPVMAVGVPRLLRPAQGVSSEKLEALEEWVRALHGIYGSGVPLSVAITQTLRSAPTPIRAEVETLVARLQARRPLAAALYAFADDLADQTGDFIASALIQASHVSGAGLSRTLDAIAAEVADEVRMRRDIEVERDRGISQARWVSLVSVGGVTALVLFTHFGQAYHTPIGQLVLLVIAAAFALCLIWMRSKATTKPAARFLIAPHQDVTP